MTQTPPNSREHGTFAGWAAFAVALLLVAAPAIATQHPNLARGFSPEKAFHVGDLDHVNLFNGNLTVTIPIGQEYSAGGSLRYRLTLVYNSNLWDWRQRQVANVGLAPEAVANGDSNAGFGWQLSLGHLVAPNTVPRNPGDRWLYIGPDGAEHVFLDTLHAGETQAANVFYSRDSSYLRLRVLDPLNKRAAVVATPDGLEHRFEFDPNYGYLTLREITDPFGNFLRVAYENAGAKWVLTDSTGRRHEVRLKKHLYDPAGRNLQERRWTVDEVHLATFGGSGIYRFKYQQASPQRPLGHDIRTGRGETATIPFLTEVVLPPAGGVFRTNGLSGYLLTNQADGAGNNTAYNPGVLRKLELPTHGMLKWKWGTYTFPTGEADQPGGNPRPVPEFLRQSTGVTRRIQTNHEGRDAGTWKYDHALTLPAGFPGVVPVEAVQTVTDPDGHRIFHYFSAYSGGPRPQGVVASELDYGLPYSPAQPNGTPRMYLSRRVVPKAGGGAQTSTYVRYERDARGDIDGQYQSHRLGNARVQRERSAHGSHERTVTRSNFDGLGHYRTTVVGGNFPQNVASRTSHTNFNPGAGTYPGSFQVPNPAVRWHLGLYDKQTQSEGGVTATRETCFGQSGFLFRERIWKGGSRSGDDLVRVYLQDSAGHVKREAYYGGDGAGLGGAGLCGLSLPPAQYEIEHTYAFGERATSRYVNAPYYLLDLTIDQNSGLPSTSRDAAGISTAFQYDALGRPTWVRPQSGHGAWTQYNYVTGGGGSLNDLAKVRIFQYPNGSTGGALVERELRFDALGRVVQNRRKIEGSWTWQTTQWDRLSRKIAESVWSSSDTRRSTKYQNFDAYGRPRLIVKPDNSEVKIGYTGLEIVHRRVGVGTRRQADGSIAETESSVAEQYDVHGRLYQVREDDGRNPLAANYRYDVGGRLVHVELEPDTGSRQNRSFSYDLRGFLLSETHPEAGTTDYKDYDARGHARRVQHRSDSKDLIYVYDDYERLTRVLDRNHNAAPLKEWAYAASNGSGNWKRGKVETATRWNRVRIPWTGARVALPVEETFTYGGPGGLVTRKITRINGQHRVFAQSWTHDDLGNVKTLSYPRCSHAGCSAAPGPPRTLTHDYRQGLLAGVRGWGTLAYHDNGALHTVTHGNGVVDRYLQDPVGMARPRDVRIELPSGAVGNLGTHVYDSSGNLVRQIKAPAEGGTLDALLGAPWRATDCETDICDNFYLYDTVGRLTRFNESGGMWQDYQYDVFGNLTEASTYDGASTTTRTFAVNTATNRLASMVTYDARGNLVARGGVGEAYEYDAFDQMISRNFPSETYLYTADGERVWTLRYLGQESNPPAGQQAGPVTSETYTLRDLDGRLLTTYGLEASNGAETWAWEKDHVYRGASLLGAATPEAAPRNAHHFTLDHLGSPRVTTDGNAGTVAVHHYWGFGEDFGPSASDPESLRFTGHERDAHGPGTADDLDYMHARHCSPDLMRFLSVDPVLGKPKIPQSWNRYAYARNNPMNLVDTDGRDVIYSHDADREFFEKHAAENRRVQAVLIYFAKGTGRNLVINRGDPGEHPGTGSRLQAVAVSTFKAASAEEIRAAYDGAGGGEAGNAAAQAEIDKGLRLVSATITLGRGSTKHVKLHELGHVEQGIRHPEQALADAKAASQAETDLDYKKSASERYADNFARAAKKKDKPNKY